jgi:hypothetical protein
LQVLSSPVFHYQTAWMHANLNFRKLSPFSWKDCLDKLY